MESAVFTLSRHHWIPRSLRETFAFFERPESLARITPPWLGLRILTPEPIVMTRGLIIDYRVKVLGFPAHWRSAIVEYEPPHFFRDLQVIGPYRSWDHRHRFSEENGGTTIDDRVIYELPLGPIGVVLHRLIVRRRLEAIFDYRRARIDELLARPASARGINQSA